MKKKVGLLCKNSLKEFWTIMKYFLYFMDLKELWVVLEIEAEEQLRHALQRLNCTLVC